MRALLFVMILLTLFPPVVMMGDVINVPADQPTIQAGIDAAADGDPVLVADGTWTGDGSVWPGEGNINEVPLFVTGPDGSYYLSQTAAGQAEDSPGAAFGPHDSLGDLPPAVFRKTRTAGIYTLQMST